jgi:copper ion binding protein
MRFLYVLLITASLVAVSCNNSKKSNEGENSEISVENLETLEIEVTGMTCGNCEKKIVKEVSALEGVKSVQASHEAENTIVEFDNSKTDLETIKKTIEDAGYTPHGHKAFEETTPTE